MLSKQSRWKVKCRCQRQGHWSLGPRARCHREPSLGCWHQEKGNVDAWLEAACVNAWQWQSSFWVKCVQHTHLVAMDKGITKEAERNNRAGSSAACVVQDATEQARSRGAPWQTPPGTTSAHSMLPDLPQSNTKGVIVVGDRGSSAIALDPPEPRRKAEVVCHGVALQTQGRVSSNEKTTKPDGISFSGPGEKKCSSWLVFLLCLAVAWFRSAVPLLISGRRFSCL